MCNSIDDNCNGEIDEDAVFATWYIDNDTDGFGDILQDSLSCLVLEGYVNNSDDCVDTNSAINPDATEICNDFDDNCNFDIDEGLPVSTFYIDADTDEFGNSDVFISSCLEIIAGYVVDSTDCDDANSAINPLSEEICNGLDDDCDGFSDENLTFYTLYIDMDGDEFGDPDFDSLTCIDLIGYVSDSTDCDDTNPYINPAIPEVLNGIDDNCNKLIDEGISIDETDLNTIIIYPNPTEDMLYIQWKEKEKGTFQLINFTGEFIQTFEKIFPVTEIDVSYYAAGIYFLKINVVGQEARLKFVKE